MGSDSLNTPQGATEGRRSDSAALNDVGALTRIADALEAIQGLLERRLAVDEATAEFTNLLKLGMAGAPGPSTQEGNQPSEPFDDYREGPVRGSYEVLRWRDGQEDWQPASAQDQMEIAQVQRGRRRL